MVRKWRADGVRFISYFASFSGPGSPDFAHTVLLEVKDLAQVQDMATDLWESDWCAFAEKHHFVIGLGSKEADAAWLSG